MGFDRAADQQMCWQPLQREMHVHKTIKAVTAAAAVLLATILPATSASAATGPYLWKDAATHRCLDSNAAGRVYTTAASACGPNDTYQDWYWSGVLMVDQATGRCLDSNAAGNVYTTKASACSQTNDYQNWLEDKILSTNGWQFFDWATNRCLD